MMQAEPQASDSSGAAHSHEHAHAESLSQVSDARLAWAVVFNQLLTVGQVAAGLLSGSSALISDAAHNFNDANALLIAYIARKVAGRGADSRHTFGYRRAEMIGALINLTLLAVVSLCLLVEGVRRLVQPVEIVGWLMGAAAIAALVVDLVTAALLWSMSQGSLNVRAAFVHNLVDAIGSVAVLAGAAAVVWLDWTWVDPAITLMIAAYVLWQVAVMAPRAVGVLMEAVPADVDLNALVDRLLQLDGVEGVHHLHVWELDEQHRALEAHVVTSESSLNRVAALRRRIKRVLRTDLGIDHSTLEIEFSTLEESGCEEQRMIPEH